MMKESVCLGRMIPLEVKEITEQGAFVDAAEYGELFVPKSQLPPNLDLGDKLRVFLYQDSGRVLATARHPYLEYGMIGRLKVSAVNMGTAYLDLGIPKELVVPVSEQRSDFVEGRSVMVYVDMDDKGRLFGTQRFNKYFKEKDDQHEFKPRQRVTVVAVSHTPLGFRTVVDDRVYGLIYKTEQKGEIVIGKRYDGYILNIRPDGKLDVTLQEPGRSGIEHAARSLLHILRSANGFIGFNDKSDAADIEDFLHMSKGKFKKAVGLLYKQRFIDITDEGISLTNQGRVELDKICGDVNDK